LCIVLAEKRVEPLKTKKVEKTLSPCHGANVLIKLGEKILVTRRRTGGRLDLPGGGLETYEQPIEAGKRELLEEVRINASLGEVETVAVLNQIVIGGRKKKVDYGFVFLFKAHDYTVFDGERTYNALEISKMPNPHEFLLSKMVLDPEEVIDAEFMGVDEILERHKEFSLAYLRMILLSESKTSNFPIYGKLGTPVEFRNKRY